MLKKTVYTIEDILDIITKNPRRELRYSLRTYINFLELFGYITETDAIKLRSVVKSKPTNPDTYVPSTEEVLEAYNRITDKDTDLVFRLLLYSGIRVVEASLMLSNYDASKVEVHDKHCLYPLMLLRKTKNVYYAFFPSEFKDDLRVVKMTQGAITKRLSRIGLPAKYLRKWNYNFMLEHGVPESVIDFIQGRQPVTVGAMHYLAKVRQANKWYSKIVTKLFEILNYI